MPVLSTAVTSLTYKSAGVDIDAGEALVEKIKPMCKATKRNGCDASLGMTIPMRCAVFYCI